MTQVGTGSDCAYPPASGGAMIHQTPVINAQFEGNPYSHSSAYSHAQPFRHRAGHWVDQSIENLTAGMMEGASDVPRAAGYSLQKTIRHPRGWMAGIFWLLSATCMVVGAYHVLPWTGKRTTHAGLGLAAAAVGYRVPLNAPPETKVFNAVGHGIGTFGKAVLTGAGEASAQTIQVQYGAQAPQSAGSVPARIQTRPTLIANPGVLPIYQGAERP
jgi:hypothetical protein